MSDRLTAGVSFRLSRYLVVLTQAKRMGRERIASRELSAYTQVNATQIRRDLSGFGKFGRRGVGYAIDLLVAELRKILGAPGERRIALIGAGRLGQAIARSPLLAEHGVTIAAVFDSDQGKVGQPIGGTVVRDCAQMGEIIRKTQVIAGVLAVPAEAAQKAADELVQAGAKLIVNYSAALLDVPEGVAVYTANPTARLLSTLYVHRARS